MVSQVGTMESVPTVVVSDAANAGERVLAASNVASRRLIAKWRINFMLPPCLSLSENSWSVRLTNNIVDEVRQQGQ